ncbi:hypothetical protein BgiMline_023277, partial [Biomphalaria glabrata]
IKDYHVLTTKLSVGRQAIRAELRPSGRQTEVHKINQAALISCVKQEGLGMS